ncbi:unnamed protein product [Somion occarium]|uniref:Uncharacterized protein n=1 Tax=Somion occarium TaxID=3059160 RepID=A0ABP1DTL6_9APHY
MARSLYGLVFETPDHRFTHLHLQSVDVCASVVDVSARVTFTQVFIPASSQHVSQSYYVFPVPPRASVSAFSMRGEDGRSIIAVVRESIEGIQMMVNANLGFIAENAFVISLGLAKVDQRLTIQLTYVTDLVHDDVSRGVRLELPFCLGSVSDSMQISQLDTTVAPFLEPEVDIKVRIQTHNKIRNVYSRSHSGVAISLDSTSQQSASRQHLIAQFHASKSLQQDFELIIEAEEQEDVSRCFAERHPEDPGSVAMHLTFIPQFSLPPSQSQEYIFLIDRSGSMTGERIVMAKHTLVMLLRSLPPEGTTFNVFSFGSSSYSLFASSRPYDDNTLHTATLSVEAMDANMGGTEICPALQSVFNSRDLVPTAVFLLTDGCPQESLDYTARVVSDAVAKSPSFAPLRVFTLGIGGANAEMCQGIASAGNGECSMAADTNQIMSECSRLVRIGRTFILRNIRIDWGVPTDATTQGAIIQQVPENVDDIYPGQRLTAFALIQHPDFVIPQFVVIRGQKDGIGHFVEFEVPVYEVQWVKWMKPHIPLLHTLAARRIVTDWQQDGPTNTGVSDTRRQPIVQLAQRYQLATKFTTFVPVEKFEAVPSPPPRPRKPDPSAAGSKTGFRTWLSPFSSRTRLESSKSARSSASRSSANQRIVDNSSDSRITATLQAISPPRHSPLAIAACQSGGSLHTGLPLDAPREVVSVISKPSQKQITSARDVSSPETLVNTINTVAIALLPPSYHPEFRETQTPATLIALPPDNDVLQLVSLQASDGSFSPSTQFTRIVGDQSDPSDQPSSDDRLWPTALAIMYLKNHLKGQPDLLDGLAMKATRFGHNAAMQSGSDFDDLLLKGDVAINGARDHVTPMTYIKPEEQEDVSVVPAETASTTVQPQNRHAFWVSGCTFLSLLVSFILILLVTLSASIIGDMYIFVIRINSTTSYGGNHELRFGAWGICTTGSVNASMALTKRNGTCTAPRSGYTIPTQLLAATGHLELNGILPRPLVSMLTLHPACVALIYLAMFASLAIANRRIAIWSSVLATLTAIASSVALVADLATAIVTRNRVTSLQTGGVSVKLGNGIWMMLAAVVLLWWSVLLLVLLIFYRKLKT